MADNDGTVFPDEGLGAQKFQRQCDLIGGSARGMDVVGVVAAALILKVFSACDAMAQAFRHQHRKTPRHQKCRQRTVFRLRHLRATQHILRGRVRDRGEPERTFALRAKQHRVCRDIGIGRRHPPLLLAVGLAFGPCAPSGGSASAAWPARLSQTSSARNGFAERINCLTSESDSSSDASQHSGE